MFRRMYSCSLSMNSCCLSKARVAVEDPLGLLPPVGGIAAGVSRQPPVLEVDDLLGDPVEEPAVVRHDEVGAPRLREVVLQELDGLEVQVIRGLVEEQDVRRREDRAREHGPILLAARKLRQRPFEIRLVEPEARECLVDLRDHVVSALVLEAMRQGVVPVVERDGRVALGHPVFHGAQLRLDLVEVGEGARGEVVKAFRDVRLQGLVDRRDAHGVGLDELAGVRLLAPERDPQEGGLARPVAAHEADLLARVVLPADVPEDLLRAVALADAVETVQHGRILPGD